jgi:hypothetical protein
MWLPGFLYAQAPRCIGTAQELIEAFADVDGSQTGELTLRLQSGTYELAADLQLDYRGEGEHPDVVRGALQIIGGFASGCGGPSSPPQPTRLVATGGQRTIGIELSNNALVLEGVASHQIEWQVANTDCRARRDLSARLTRLDLSAGRLRFDDMGCYDILLHGSQVQAPADGAAAVAYQAGRMPDSRPPRFSISASTLRGGGLDLAFLASEPGEEPLPASVHLHGSVFESDGPEVVIDGGNLHAIHNRYDSLSIGRGTVMVETGTVTAPALLQIDGRPRPRSPLINAGTRSMPGGLPHTDLSGTTRLVGTQPDIGAFETSVDDAIYLDVTSTATSGPGSLAAAITAANAAPGRQTIRFALAGPCPHLITLTDTLVMTGPTDILGGSQAGSVANTREPGYNGVPCVVLRDAFASAALVINGSAPEDSLRVSDLAFSGFFGSVIGLWSGRDHLVTGNQFGGMVGAFKLQEAGIAVRTDNASTSAQIGGPDAAQANLVGEANHGVFLAGAGGNQVIGNAIGDDGEQSLSTTVSVRIQSPDNLVADNWIGESLLTSVVLASAAAQRNRVRDNHIFDAGIWGIELGLGAHHNRIGPDNRVAGSRNTAIYVGTGSFNDLGGNRFADNEFMAIDLGAFGVTPNDPDPLVDVNAPYNRYQNFPVLRQAFLAQVQGLPRLVVTGALSSTEGVYRLELYGNEDCQPKGHGEGIELLAASTVVLACPQLPVDNQCLGSFELLLPPVASEGQLVSAIVTSPAGHTSEFSACLAVDNGDRIFSSGFD